MDRRGVRYSYNSQDYEDTTDRRAIDRMFTGRGHADCGDRSRVKHQRSQCPCEEANDGTACQCAVHMQQQQQLAPMTYARQTLVGGSLDSLDLKQMLLFAGIGILFVLAVDGLIRLAGSKRSGGAITIEGKTYVPL